MAKEKIELFEEIVFDDVQYAVDMYNAYKKKLAKVKKGIMYAVIASACNMFCWIPTMLGAEETLLIDICMIVGIIFTIIAYVKGGGISRVFSWAWRVAKVTWITFVFPFDFIFAMLAWYISLVGFLFVPIIFVLINYNQIKMYYESAEEYIRYFKKKATAIPVYEDEYEECANPNYGRMSSSYERSVSNYGRSGASYDRPSSNYGRTSSGYERTGGGYGRTSSSYERSGSNYGRSGTSYDRPSSNYGRTSSGYERTGSGYGRTSSSYDRPSSTYGRTNSTYGQTRTGSSYRQTGSGSSYNRTGGYSSTRNYR